jgi:hypothetical protein
VRCRDRCTSESHTDPILTIGRMPARSPSGVANADKIRLFARSFGSAPIRSGSPGTAARSCAAFIISSARRFGSKRCDRSVSRATIFPSRRFDRVGAAGVTRFRRSVVAVLHRPEPDLGRRESGSVRTPGYRHPFGNPRSWGNNGVWRWWPAHRRLSQPGSGTPALPVAGKSQALRKGHKSTQNSP